ncbi:unnamed protein product [Euphydryas editha]|uniref:Transposase n=1 Tax=Euphydryas editha TaxID=104508 RepID=A0AAU9VDZ1_EUPED|nr:unnamed protein product [Euphydryas editha]
MLDRFRNFNNIFFSDEAHFHINGHVNKQNCRYWSSENPKTKHQRPLHSPKVTVWAAISANGIIGPYFFEDFRGRGWPRDSCPDLTPADFFLWGYLKHRVYAHKPKTLFELKAKIRNEMSAISVSLCRRVFENFRARLEECRSRNGDHLNDIIFKK